MNIAALLVLAGSPVHAQEIELDPSLPIPTLKYERPPPDYSWEVGLHLGYGEVAYWKQEIPPWPQFGIRVGWGRNFGSNFRNRLGVTSVLFFEGPMLVHLSTGIDPQLSYDYVSKGNLWFGAGVGGAAMVNRKRLNTVSETKVAFAPSATVHLGWSQTWSRVGRRLFVGAEPRVRFANGNVGTAIAVVVGSGKGY